MLFHLEFILYVLFIFNLWVVITYLRFLSFLYTLVIMKQAWTHPEVPYYIFECCKATRSIIVKLYFYKELIECNGIRILSIVIHIISYFGVNELSSMNLFNEKSSFWTGVHLDTTWITVLSDSINIANVICNERNPGLASEIRITCACFLAH